MYTSRGILALVLSVVLVLGFSTTHAAILEYEASMDGPSESPPVPSPGIGSAQVTIDTSLRTMRVQASFTGLVGTTTIAHIHAPTLVAFAGNAGVATTLPSFPGWPTGVMAGSYDMTFDMTLASTYNTTFINNNGGTPAGAEAALLQFIADGKAYFNVHTSFRTGGEIRGFLTPAPVPTAQSTWGAVKALYR